MDELNNALDEAGHSESHIANATRMILFSIHAYSPLSLPKRFFKFHPFQNQTAKMLKIWSMVNYPKIVRDQTGTDTRLQKQQQQKAENAESGGGKKKKVTAAQLRVQKGM